MDLPHRSLPLFRMRIHHKTCVVLLDTGSTVNVVGHDVLREHLKIPNKFLQRDPEKLGKISGITGQKISNVGNIQLQTDFLGHKSVENFVVLPKATFGADALVGFPTMKKWGLIIDCEEERAIRDNQETEVCLQLEEETSSPNLINLDEINLESEENMLPTLNTQSESAPTVVEEESKESPDELVLNTLQSDEGQHLVDRPPESEEAEAEDPEMVQPTCHEVLCLGKLTKDDFVGFSAYESLMDSDQAEEISLVSQDAGDNDDITLISTACDNTVTFRVMQNIRLRPGELTKVHLRAHTLGQPGENFQSILLGDSLPEAIKMDHSLVNVSGSSTTSYVTNSTDKTMTLTADSKFCRGIVVTNPLITLGEHTFSTLASSGLDDEVNMTDFPEHRSELLEVLKTFRDTVAIHGDKLGKTEVLQHKIILADEAKPFFIPNYRLPLSRRAAVDEIIKEMKEEGIVVPSKSPYNSPLLLVPKKDGTWRLVIDYRKLNSQTVPDRLPMPVINDVLAQLGGAKVFSSLDLLSGYWQVPLAEESKPLTAFSTHNEHLEYQVMPFGLTSAPLTFVRLMQQVLGGMEDVMVYLDDIIIFSKDMDSHFRTLREVLTRLRNAGLKVKVRKCQFLQKSLEYLGHVVTPEGIRMQKARSKAFVTTRHQRT